MEKFFHQIGAVEMQTGTVRPGRLRPPWLCLGRSCFRLIQLKDLTCSFEIDDGPVDDHLVFAGVWRNVMQIFNGVTVSPQLSNDEVDIYHMVD
jgi:hypothetical protein